MATQYRATHTELKERYFTCERCGAFGEVQFQAVGVGYAKDQFWQDDGADRARMAAADELQADGDRVYGLIRCPACRQRPKHAFLGMYFRIGLPTVGGLAALIPDLFQVTIACGALAAYLLYRDLRRLGRANRAMVYKLTKPAPEPEGTTKKKEKDYKPLRASKPSQPPRPATAPVVPVRTSAPEIVKPRGPDDGPGFLK